MKLGILTVKSWQEGRPPPGVAWIVFCTQDHAKDFLDVVAVYPDEDDMHLVNDQQYVGDKPLCETLYGRIADFRSDNAWKFRLFPHNWGVEPKRVGDKLIDTGIGDSDFSFWVSIRFPITDIPLIVERLHEVLSQRECSRHESELRSVEGSQQADQQYKGDTIEVPEGLREQAGGGGEIASSSRSGGLPDTANGESSLEDDRGSDHMSGEVEDLL